jgi:transposase
MQDLGYCRRASKKKGFSTDLKVMALRKAFAEEGIKWTRERVQRQMFTDEVWAMGGAHTTSFVTVLANGSESYLPECLQHKHSKAPAWMFHGSIVNGTKGLVIFWEKKWGSINSTKYNEYILSRIAEFMAEHADSKYIFMQDNALAHSSYKTKINLLDRAIRWIKHPPYSLDLNLIEHVWNWMKNWIQKHYWEARYKVNKLSLEQLRGIYKKHRKLYQIAISKAYITASGEDVKL